MTMPSLVPRKESVNETRPCHHHPPPHTHTLMHTYTHIDTANSQIVVDNDRFCEKLSLGCGKPGGPSSGRYCCVEGDGSIPIYRCCNPYAG